MIGWPENSCLMCDMPWKNNRVRYEGGPACPCVGGKNGAAACLCLGEVHVTLTRDGEAIVSGCGETLRHQTGLSVQEGTLAADVLTRTLYFSAGRRVCALNMNTGDFRWKADLQDTANSPMLFERLQVDGEVQLLLGVTDQNGRVYVLDRENGRLIWQVETGFSMHSVPAHRDGRLFLACDGAVACLDADNGDAIWVQPDREKSEGLLTDKGYERGNIVYSVVDGSPLND